MTWASDQCGGGGRAWGDNGGVSESEKQSAEPARNGAPSRRRGPRRAVRRGTERETVLGVSEDERPAGWGEGAEPDAGHGSNDEQLRRDVPPHWS